MRSFFSVRGFAKFALLFSSFVSVAFSKDASFVLDASVIESFSAFPSVTLLNPPAERLPNRSFSSFGAQELNPQNKKSPQLVCGPDADAHTLACYDLLMRSYVGKWPIPGSVTSKPVYAEGMWFVGTSEGFFVALDSTFLGKESIAFWGNHSRLYAHLLRPRLTQGASAKTLAPKTEPLKPSGWRWHHAGSTEFVGTPVVKNGFIYALAANQFIHAFEIATGRLVWASRLSTDIPLRLTSVSIQVAEKEILAGSNDGYLVALNPTDGNVMWRVLFPSKAEDRFQAITAAPLLLGRSVVASNASNVTQRVSLDSQRIEWSYPIGSGASPAQTESAVIVGGSDGSVVSLNKSSGALIWKKELSAESPIVSVYTLAAGKIVIAASQNGTIFILDTVKGTILQRLNRMGDVSGEFFAGASQEEVCLSFSAPGMRCFELQLRQNSKLF